MWVTGELVTKRAPIDTSGASDDGERDSDHECLQVVEDVLKGELQACGLMEQYIKTPWN